MKMLAAYMLSLLSTAAMAGVHAAGLDWPALDALFILGIVTGLLSAPFIMDHPSTR